MACEERAGGLQSFITFNHILYRVEHAVMQTHMRGCAHKSVSSLVLKKRGVDDGGGGVCVVYIVLTPF